MLTQTTHIHYLHYREEASDLMSILRRLIWGSLPAGTYRKGQEIDLSKFSEIDEPEHDPLDIEYTSLFALIKSKGWPDEYLISPEDFEIIQAKFARPSCSGHDQRGMYMFVGPTRIRPSREGKVFNWS